MLGRMSGMNSRSSSRMYPEADALKIAERLRKDAEASRTWQGSHTFPVTVSAGMVMYPGTRAGCKNVFHKGRRCHVPGQRNSAETGFIYSPSGTRRLKDQPRFKWKERIPKALRRTGSSRGFSRYRPNDNRVHHFEALPRTTTAEGEVLLPERSLTLRNDLSLSAILTG